MLTVNKMGQCFLELKLNEKKPINSFSIAENANVVMATYVRPLLGDVQVLPR